MLEDLVHAIQSFLHISTASELLHELVAKEDMDLEGRLMYHCKAGPIRVEPNPLGVLQQVSSVCTGRWSSGSLVPSYTFMLGKENFLGISIRVISSVKGVSA